MTIADDVLACVRERPGLRAREIAAIVGCQPAMVAFALRRPRRRGLASPWGTIILVSDPGLPMEEPECQAIVRRLRLGWWTRSELTAVDGPSRAIDARALRPLLHRAGIYPLHPDGSITLPDGSRLPHGAAAWAARRVA